MNVHVSDPTGKPIGEPIEPTDEPMNVHVSDPTGKPIGEPIEPTGEPTTFEQGK